MNDENTERPETPEEPAAPAQAGESEHREEPLSVDQPEEPKQPISPEPVPPPVIRTESETLVILGFVIAAIGIVFSWCCCCSWPFAIAAIIIGAIAMNRGDQRGLWILIIGIVALGFGGVFHWIYKFSNPWMPGMPYHFRGPWA